MRRLRSLIFWLHLGIGAAAGIAIAVMSATGAALALKPQILDIVDRDVRFVRPPSPSASRLGVQTLVDRVRAARPGAQVASITIDADRKTAATVGLGRNGSVYVDPFTGRVLGGGSDRARLFFRGAEDWHRWLGAPGEGRAVGRSLTGAANLGFLLLALSGLFLWWPRRWVPGHVKAILRPRWPSTPRARDFNWHNAFGFWCAPIIIILTATGVVMSYPWANRLLYAITNSPLPAAQGGTQSRSQTSDAPNGAPAENLDAAWTAAEQRVPEWRAITMRLPARAGAPVVLSVSDARSWNRFARSTVTASPTGDVLRWEAYGDTSLGQKARGWVRFAHTGELAGTAGQLIAGLACLAGIVLVWSGLSLGVRRLAATVRCRLPLEKHAEEIIA